MDLKIKTLFKSIDWLSALIYFLIILSIAFVTIWALEGYFHPGTDLDDSNSSIVSDIEYHFSVRMPEGWHLNRVDDPESFFRFSITSPDQLISLGLYAYKSGLNIDLEKFADSDRNMFVGMGELKEERRVNNHFPYSTIERIYGVNEKGFYCRARYKRASNYGYVAMSFSKTEAVTADIPILDSLDPSVPIFIKIKSKLKTVISFKNILGSIFGLILSLVIFVVVIIPVCYLVLVPFGLTGMEMRKGFKMLAALRKVRINSIKEGLILNKKYYSAKKIAILRAFGIMLGWVIIYTILIIILPRKAFYFSLIGLVGVFTGNLGIILRPNIDPGNLVENIIESIFN
ncbi:MAG: hypothetical protein KOO63_12520 [Bacteroidales bacterium]|nr:hypothetical protein [Candidatus Latescibacterota bacterium]